MDLHLKKRMKTLWPFGTMCISLLLYSCTTGGTLTTPTASNLARSPSPETILFEARIKDDSCKDVEEPIEFLLRFTNSSAKPSRLANLFIVSKDRNGYSGNIIPRITLDGEDIYSPRDVLMFDPPLPRPETYIELPPAGTLNLSFQYHFPVNILERSLSNEEIVVTPSPGTYLVSFGFFQIDYGFDNWDGNVRSNLVEICILN